MGYIITNDDITKATADIIINASNGIGYMGGMFGRFIKLRGVAESIHYATHGIVEKEAKRICKEKKYKAGEIFITSAGNLNAKYVLHAVTMDLPGMTTNIDVIKVLLPKIIKKAYHENAKSIAIPLLGTGTGKINKDDVKKLYEEFFNDINDIKITLYIK